MFGVSIRKQLLVDAVVVVVVVAVVGDVDVVVVVVVVAVVGGVDAAAGVHSKQFHSKPASCYEKGPLPELTIERPALCSS